MGEELKEGLSACCLEGRGWEGVGTVSNLG